MASNPSQVTMKKPDDTASSDASAIATVECGDSNESSKGPGKPTRPLTGYHLFFQLEREYILQTTDRDTDAAVYGPRRNDNRPLGKELDDKMPFRYRYIHLNPHWYASGSGKRVNDGKPLPKRKHRRTHGKISFLDLSKAIAVRWADLDEKDKATKRYVQDIAARELEVYKRKMRIFKESLDKSMAQHLHPVSSQSTKGGSAKARKKPESPLSSSSKKQMALAPMSAPSGIINSKTPNQHRGRTNSFNDTFEMNSYMGTSMNNMASSATNNFSFHPVPSSFWKQCNKNKKNNRGSVSTPYATPVVSNRSQFGAGINNMTMNMNMSMSASLPMNLKSHSTHGSEYATANIDNTAGVNTNPFLRRSIQSAPPHITNFTLQQQLYYNNNSKSMGIIGGSNHTNDSMDQRFMQAMFAGGESKSLEPHRSASKQNNEIDAFLRHQNEEIKRKQMQLQRRGSTDSGTGSVRAGGTPPGGYNGAAAAPINAGTGNYNISINRNASVGSASQHQRLEKYSSTGSGDSNAAPININININVPSPMQNRQLQRVQGAANIDGKRGDGEDDNLFISGNFTQDDALGLMMALSDESDCSM